MTGLPNKQGLYNPINEKDSCGVGFIAKINGDKSHSIIEQGLTMLKRLHHRGAVGADTKAGDGTGMLVQIPDTFFRDKVDFELPPPGNYGVGMIFMPKGSNPPYEQKINQVIYQEGLHIIGWRKVPVNNSGLGHTVIPNEPDIWQVFIGEEPDIDTLERKLFVIHKQIAAKAAPLNSSEHFYICSMSARTIAYKGMLLAHQIADYFLDLHDELFVSAFSLVHQRFSTNTFPTWALAHPFRMIAHNGEINTLRGNVNWMASRKSAMKSEILGDDLNKIFPIIPDGQSDSASLDNALELLVMAGYSLSHAIMMLIPEAWESNKHMPKEHTNFYEYNAALMEPWDGPAAVAFTDGKQIGATLDRNGLRPAKYIITKDGLVVLASEFGVLDIPEENIVKKWRLQPGKMLLLDLEKGKIIDNEDIKNQLSRSHPYQDWLNKGQIKVLELPKSHDEPVSKRGIKLLRTQQAFGYTQEDIKFLLNPMITTGVEATGSMGTDVPPAIMSDRPQHLSSYFKQNFAQVTNPPIDPIREAVVMSLVSFIGPKPNVLSHDNADSHIRIEMTQPVLSNKGLDAVRKINRFYDDFNTITIDITFKVGDNLQKALKDICKQAENATGRFNIIILSDRTVSPEWMAIPALLATSAVHQHLIKKGLRTKTGLIVETAAALEVHHFATLAGFGAEAINPWLAYDTIRSQADYLGIPESTAKKNYVKAIGKGILKVMSKMGISTYLSYCGAQIFDSIGLNKAFINKYFTGTNTVVEGIGLDEIYQDMLTTHTQAYGKLEWYKHNLDIGGNYAYRVKGERHIWNPDTISTMQHAVRTNSKQKYQQFADLINKSSKKLNNFRALMKFRYQEHPLDIDQVEPAKEIVKRFVTGAMSFGSISYEAHSALAIAMNTLGAKSNTGEGGEESSRYAVKPDGSPNLERSAIKQVASGRFGVTTEYLVNSDEIQIKMAQGAKPGEGGQLPGHKVNQQIANVRHSTKGVGLISPPPHHDIYSIEDLAQLIYDLKNVNPKARISVKLVSEVGVGTIAAGVVKAHADHLTISGFDGGTGASPLTSIKHTGLPWEIGLAETHQILVMNDLRSRVCVQTDGGLRTGRDVAIAALLGADEFAFSTAPLIAEGCLMMRKCHLNTCPVGIATQDEELRKRFKGKPEHVINYFFFVANELRQIMAKLGFKTVNEMIGQRDKLIMKPAIEHYKAKGLDYSNILFKTKHEKSGDIYNSQQQDHKLEKALDNQLIELAQPALINGDKVNINIDTFNYHRSLGSMLSGTLAKKYGHSGLPNDTITINTKGFAGQSLGAWLSKGITIVLSGAGNDYVGKGLSGGKIIIKTPKNSGIDASHNNLIVGNTVLFGAISGEAYFNGVAGERFCVRNSGATTVVEGVGDHGCEYMTGGVMVCLGKTGRNFAAGMSGGIAYVLDEDQSFFSWVNSEMVQLSFVEPDSSDTDLSNMLAADEHRLKTLITNHLKYTNSQLAKKILDDWQYYLPKFVKVTPNDFQKALQEQSNG